MRILIRNPDYAFEFEKL